MEACDLFSETMELHSEDVEYFYIESKRVTERRKRERDNLRREISILKEEKEGLREENQQLRQTNKQLKERLSVQEGKIYGDLARRGFQHQHFHGKTFSWCHGQRQGRGEQKAVCLVEPYQTRIQP